MKHRVRHRIASPINHGCPHKIKERNAREEVHRARTMPSLLVAYRDRHQHGRRRSQSYSSASRKENVIQNEAPTSNRGVRGQEPPSQQPVHHCEGLGHIISFPVFFLFCLFLVFLRSSKNETELLFTTVLYERRDKQLRHPNRAY